MRRHFLARQHSQTGEGKWCVGTDCCVLASGNLLLMRVQGRQAHELET